MEIKFQTDYYDEIILYKSDESKENLALLHKAGYDPDEHGEVTLYMKFGDGIAYIPNGGNIVLHYPTLAEVRASKKMQNEITEYNGRTDMIIPYDVALKYGTLGTYKYVLDYNKWSEDESNDKDIFSIHTEEKDNLCIQFDAFEEDFLALDDDGYLKENEVAYILRDGLSKEDIHNLQAKYGILWTEWIGNHVFDEKGNCVELS